MKSRLLLFLFAICCLQACQEDNLDEIETEILPTAPIEITTQDALLTYRLQQIEISYESGYGVILENPLGSTLYAVASDTFQCSSEIGVDRFGLSINGSFTDFFVSFYVYEDGEAVSNSAILQTVINGDTITAYGNSFVSPECRADVPFVVNIEEQTASFLKGTYETEFFQLIPDTSSTQITCENWQSLGILSADFAVPLGSCD